MTCSISMAASVSPLGEWFGPFECVLLPQCVYCVCSFTSVFFTVCVLLPQCVYCVCSFTSVCMWVYLDICRNVCVCGPT